jgi:pilus assembly protein CpaB
MRRFPSWVWLLLAVGFAIIASVMALGWLQRQAALKPSHRGKPIFVVVANTGVNPDTLLGLAQLKTVVWHQGMPPKGSFGNPEQVVGRLTMASLMAGELVTEAKLVPKGGLPGITALLSPNQRAMTVKVDEASGVAGFLSPGDRVDVVVIVDRGPFAKNPFSKLLFQNLKVLGTGQKIETRPGDKPQIVPTITLEVSPAEGERLALAAQEGRISLVLRGQGDRLSVDTLGVDASQLFGRPQKAAPVSPVSAPPRRTVEVIRGNETGPVTF